MTDLVKCFVVTMCSSTLHRMLVKEIGLLLEVSGIYLLEKRADVCSVPVIGHSTSIK